MHVELIAAPMKELNVPASQGVQEEAEEAPVILLNEPAAHGIGSTDDHGQNEPAGQMTGAPDEQ